MTYLYTLPCTRDRVPTHPIPACVYTNIFAPQFPRYTDGQRKPSTAHETKNSAQDTKNTPPNLSELSLLNALDRLATNRARPSPPQQVAGVIVASNRVEARDEPAQAQRDKRPTGGEWRVSARGCGRICVKSVSKKHAMVVVMAVVMLVAGRGATSQAGTLAARDGTGEPCYASAKTVQPNALSCLWPLSKGDFRTHLHK